MSRMKKPIKKGRLPGRPEHYRTPIAYINVPIMSMQKKQNRKTTRFQHSLLKQKYHIFKE